MGSGRKLVLLALAAGLLRAADSPDLVYKFHLPKHVARVDWTAASVGNWQVTVTVDPAECELSCAYRLKHGSPAVHLLPPPILVVRIYSDAVSLPQTVTVDPAGLDFPAARSQVPASHDRPYVPGRKLFAAALPQAGESLPPAPPQSQPCSASRSSASPAVAAPLRN